MKTAIFINTLAKMKNYDMDSLLTYGIKNLAIVSKNDFAKFHQKYAAYFSAIHCSPECETGEFGQLSYQFSSQIVRDELNKNQTVRIVCQSEDNLLLAAKLRDEFNLAGMGYNEILPFRDKVVMKDKIKQAGLRVPGYSKLNFDAAEDINGLFVSLSGQLGLPFLLKPIDALGGAGIKKITNFDDFQRYHGVTQFTQYEAEEFIVGELYHADSIVSKGEILFSVCCQYTNPNFDFQSGKSVISCPLKEDNKTVKAILEFNKDVLKAMNLTNGVSHLEIFVKSNGEIVFLEVAARSPGAVVTPMYRCAFNVAFEDTAYKIEMDLPIELSIQSNKYYMSGILPTIQGVVSSLNEPKIASEYQLTWQVNCGDHLNSPASLRDQSGAIIVWNENYEQLLQDFNYLKHYNAVNVL